MTMDAWTTLLGLDPSGPEIAALCALEALLLAVIVLSGFGLLWRSQHRPGRRTAPAASYELGLQELWRLHRGLGRESTTRNSVQSSRFGLASRRPSSPTAVRPDPIAGVHG